MVSGGTDCVDKGEGCDGDKTDGGEADLAIGTADVVDGDGGCNWVEIDGKDGGGVDVDGHVGVDGEVEFNAGEVGGTETRDEIVVWPCPLKVTSEVPFKVGPGVTTGPLFNDGQNFDCSPDQKESYVRDVGLKPFVVEADLLTCGVEDILDNVIGVDVRAVGPKLFPVV